MAQSLAEDKLEFSIRQWGDRQVPGEEGPVDPVASKDRHDLEVALKDVSGGGIVDTTQVTNDTEGPAGRISTPGELAGPAHWTLAQFCEAGNKQLKVSVSGGEAETLISEMPRATRCASQTVRI